jgi:hypothetical protein
MYAAYQPAPLSEWVYYLAVFRRALLSIQEYAEQRDSDRMLLGGYLADALHNVPALLWHYEDGGWHDPARIRGWIQNYPQHLQKLHAPIEVVAGAVFVVSPDNDARRLGLENDFSNHNIPPTETQELLLDMLYASCLWMRGIRGFGRATRHNAAHHPWHRLYKMWNEEAMEFGTFNGLLAEAQRDIPCALLRWQDYGVTALTDPTLWLMDSVPERYRDWWQKHFRLEGAMT